MRVVGLLVCVVLLASACGSPELVYSPSAGGGGDASGGSGTGGDIFVGSGGMAGAGGADPCASFPCDVDQHCQLNGGDPECVAQQGSNLFGKILRLDVDRAEEGKAWSIPPDNPFPGSPVWATGLRNPWRFSFDRRTGDLWIGDVGEKLREDLSHDFETARPSPHPKIRMLETEGVYLEQPTLFDL